MAFYKSLFSSFTSHVEIIFWSGRDRALRLLDISSEPDTAIGIARAEARRHTAIRSVKGIGTAPDVRSAGIAASVSPSSRVRLSCGADPHGRTTKRVAIRCLGRLLTIYVRLKEPCVSRTATLRIVVGSLCRGPKWQQL